MRKKIKLFYMTRRAKYDQPHQEIGLNYEKSSKQKIKTKNVKNETNTSTGDPYFTTGRQ